MLYHLGRLVPKGKLMLDMGSGERVLLLFYHGKPFCGDYFCMNDFT